MLPLSMAALIFAQATYDEISLFPPKDGVLLKKDVVLGGDFIAFYTGGYIFGESRAHLYDLENQATQQKRILGGAAGMQSSRLPFIYPPLVAAFFFPLTVLDFEHAFYGAATLALVSGVWGVFFLAQRLEVPIPWKHLTLLLGSLGFVPFYVDTVMGGQLAWLGIVAFSGLSVLVIDRRYFWAGAFLGLGYYKPPLFLFAAIYLSIRCGWRFFGGALAATFVLALLTVAAVGVDGLEQYIRTASRYTYGQDFMPGFRLPPAQGAGIFAFTTSVFGISIANFFVLVLMWIGLLAMAVYRTVRQEEISLVEIGFAITASVGLSVQCIKYDLALLLVPFLLFAADYTRSRSAARYVGAGCIALFYFEFAVRGVDVLGVTLNLSSLLFLVLTGTLAILVYKTGTGQNADGPAMLKGRAG